MHSAFCFKLFHPTAFSFPPQNLAHLMGYQSKDDGFHRSELFVLPFYSSEVVTFTISSAQGQKKLLTNTQETQLRNSTWQRAKTVCEKSADELFTYKMSCRLWGEGGDLALRLITPLAACKLLTWQYPSPLSSACPSTRLPPAGNPPSGHLVCDIHKVMQDGGAAADGWIHYLV